MRLATCICGEHGSVNVSGDGFGRTFGRGAVVDLDERVKPDVETTWGEAIGEAYAHLFEEESPSHGRARSPRRSVPADVAEIQAASGMRSIEPTTE